MAGDSPSKDRTRAALIELGGAAAKKQGFASLGVDAIAKAAGYTSGALYKHFQDKASLFKEIVRAELRQATEAWTPEREGDVSHLERKLDEYLSLKHVQHPEIGALLPSLAAEIGRASQDVKSQYEKELLALRDVLLKTLHTEDQVWVTLSLCAGAVMLARGAVDIHLSEQMIKAAREHLQTTIVDPCRDT